jgi:hypothetical protein
MRLMSISLYRHKFHSAFRTIARMIGYYFGVHRARVFLFLMLLLMVVVVARAIEVNRPYLCGSANREHHRADKNRKPFLHFGCTSSVVAAVSDANGVGKRGRHACRYSGRF